MVELAGLEVYNYQHMLDNYANFIMNIYQDSLACL